jgi:glucan phosphoethanolaminetransferase (alkaline phosphatase superfamily)
VAVFAAPAVRLSHFASMLLFALFVSLALACVVPRRSAMERLKYAAWSFFLFLAIGVGIAWLMYPLSR